MKIVAKPVDMIFRATANGQIRPLRFKLQGEADGAKIVEVEQIIKTEISQLAGQMAFVFTCQSAIDQMVQLYELRYTVNNCKWVLYKV